MPFTQQQQDAIQDRSSYLLVSAAAGAGKTAVLVQRIVSMLLHDNMDLERILVMTFTNAAAAELKDRIAKELLDRADTHPELMDQYSKVSRANIGTMHSFCKQIIRQEFPVVGVDPRVRIASSSYRERLYLKAQRRAMEIAYENAGEQIQSLSMAYSEERIIELLNDLYSDIMSFPHPMEWLRQHCGLDDTLEDNGAPLFAPLYERYLSLLDSMKEALRAQLQTYRSCVGPALPDKLAEMIAGDCGMLETLLAAADLSALRRQVELASFSRFPTLKDPQDKAAAEPVKALREELKEAVSALDETLAMGLNFDEDCRVVRLHIQALCQILMVFHRLFNAAKREKNLIDFNDMEHMALTILQTEGVDEKIRNSFDAIFIDECQDNSSIQEEILRALKSDSNTVFMVGDVKQSIYRFRNAEPKLFIEKLKRYQFGEGHRHRKILLNKNFRSNPMIIDASNRVFHTLLKEEATELNYHIDEDWLHPGRTDEIGAQTRFRSIICDDKSNPYALQAAYIAKQIRALVGTQHPTENRKIQHRDIAILCPQLKNVDHVLDEYLGREEIPHYSDVVTATSNNLETEQLMAWLSLICNAYDDLALLAILRGPVFGLSDEILAQIRLLYPDRDIHFAEAFYYCASLAESIIKTEYDAEPQLMDAKAEVNWDSLNAHDTLYTFREARARRDWLMAKTAAGEEERRQQLALLCSDIRRLISQERFLIRQVKIDVYLWSVVVRSGLQDYFESQLNGDELMNNIRAFCLRAHDYLEETGDEIEDFIKDCRITQGMGGSLDPVLLSPYDDLVRVMTIHKSKGLEFPIVFIMGLHLGLTSRMDERAELMLHKDYGIAMQYRNPESRIRRSTAIYAVMKSIKLHELKAERARLLYVAMTRARDVLYLVSSEKILPAPPQSAETADILAAKSYAEWLRLALRGAADLEQSLQEPLDDWQGLIDMQICPVSIPKKKDPYAFYPWDIRYCLLESGAALLQPDAPSVMEDSSIDEALDRILQMPPQPKISILKRSWEDTRITQKGKRIPEKYSVSAFCDILLKSDQYRIRLPVSDHPVTLPPPHEIPDFKPVSINTVPDVMETLFQEHVQTASEIGTLTHFLLEVLPLEFVRRLFHGKGLQQTYQSMQEQFLWQSGDIHHTELLDAETIEKFRKELLEKSLHSPALCSLYEELERQAHLREHPQRRGSQADFSRVDIYSICDFFLSDIGIRMLNSNLVCKEHPFTLHLKGWKVLFLSGTIDLCFLEGDQWILVDFKTDSFADEKISEKYLYQIAMYKLALDSLTPYRVKECYIYSLRRRQAIRV